MAVVSLVLLGVLRVNVLVMLRVCFGEREVSLPKRNGGLSYVGGPCMCPSEMDGKMDGVDAAEVHGAHTDDGGAKLELKVKGRWAVHQGHHAVAYTLLMRDSGTAYCA